MKKSSAGQAGKSRSEKKAYESPKLTVYGPVAKITLKNRRTRDATRRRT